MTLFIGKETASGPSQLSFEGSRCPLRCHVGPGSTDVSGSSEDEPQFPQLHCVGSHSGITVAPLARGRDLQWEGLRSLSGSQVFFLCVHRMFPVWVEVNLA